MLCENQGINTFDNFKGICAARAAFYNIYINEDSKIIYCLMRLDFEYNN